MQVVSCVSGQTVFHLAEWNKRCHEEKYPHHSLGLGNKDCRIGDHVASVL